MPVNFSVRPIRDRFTPFPVRAQETGGYARVDRPDPNDPIEGLRRQGFQSGTVSMRALPVGGQTPTITPSGESATSRNVNLMQRALAQEEQAKYDVEPGEKRWMAPTVTMAPQDARRNLFLRDPKWQALRQALFEAGADRLRTGARAGYAPRGFFDTQSTMNPNQQNLAALLEAMDLNEGRQEQAARTRLMR